MLPSFSRRKFALGLLATFALLLPQGAPLARAQQPATSSFPLTITDDAGVSSTFTASPQHIVSLNPGLTEITFALGVGSRLVAVDTYSDCQKRPAAADHLSEPVRRNDRQPEARSGHRPG